MNGKYTIVIAIVAIAIIIGSAGASPTSHPTASPTANPTANPTATPTPTASPSPTPIPSPVALNGAGATFPYPLLNAMITNYTTAKSYVQVIYQSIGSGGICNAAKNC